MALIQLNAVLLDYLSLTSFSEKWFNYMMEGLASEGDEYVEVRNGGYAGRMVPLVSGSLSFLSGVQKGKEHFMVKISGVLAHHAIQTCLDLSRGFSVSCTRMDVQITIMKPVNMSMTALRNRLEKKYRKVGYPQPEIVNDKKIETVYVGERTKSDRFYRFYVKPTNDGHALRSEVELKKRRSRAIFEDWVKNGVSGEQVNYEIEKMAGMDKYLARLILPLSGGSKRVMVRTLEGNTERWLINQVFPVLKRVLCSHSSDSVSVYGALLDVLEAYEESNNENV